MATRLRDGAAVDRAEAVIKRRAEQQYRRMLAANGGEHSASLLAATAKHFIVAIPLMGQEKPVPMSLAFQRCAKAEYEARYLEEIGAVPTETNCAMVDRHMNVERQCTAAAAWKSRGSVADYLYLAPHWPNPVDGSAASPRTRKGASRRSAAPDALDVAIVDATLARLDSRRRLSVAAQRAPPRRPRATVFSRGSLDAMDTVALLEAFENPEARSGPEEGEPKLRLRCRDLEAMRGDLADLIEEAARRERVQRVKERPSEVRRRKHKAKQKAAAKTAVRDRAHTENLFDKGVQLYPSRAVVSVAKKAPKEEAPRSARTPDPLVLSPRIQQELQTSMRERASEPAITGLVREVLEMFSATALTVVTPAELVKALAVPSVVALVQLAAIAVFRSAILDNLKALGTRMPNSEELHTVEHQNTLRRSQSFLQRPGESLARDASFAKASARSVSSKNWRQSALDSSQHQRLSVANRDSAAAQGSRRFELPVEEESTEELVAQFAAAFADEKARLKRLRQRTSVETVPVLTLLVRACVDALMLCYYPRTQAAICVALEYSKCGPDPRSPASPSREEGALPSSTQPDQRSLAAVTRRRQLREDVVVAEACHAVRLSADVLLRSIMDPGGFLERSKPLQPSRPVCAPGRR